MHNYHFRPKRWYRLDSWRFSRIEINLALHGQTRQRKYFFILKQLKDRVMECKILPTIYHSDSSDVALFVSDKKASSLGDLGPGRLLNSLLSDTNYVIILTWTSQRQSWGLYWEMIKMESRAFTIAFSKKKAKRKRHEEPTLLSEMSGNDETADQTPDITQLLRSSLRE